MNVKSHGLHVLLTWLNILSHFLQLRKTSLSSPYCVLSNHSSKIKLWTKLQPKKLLHLSPQPLQGHRLHSICKLSPQVCHCAKGCKCIQLGLMNIIGFSGSWLCCDINPSQKSLLKYAATTLVHKPLKGAVGHELTFYSNSPCWERTTQQKN